MNSIEIKEKVMDHGEVCDHCLGRQITLKHQGIMNEVIGAALRKSNTEKEVSEFIEKEEATPKVKGECFLCKGLFAKLGEMYEKLQEEESNWEFSNFLVGSKIPKEVVKEQEELWTEIPPKDAEPIRREINREIGKKLSKDIDKEPEFEEPQIVFILNFSNEEIETQVKSIYIYGKYRKLERGIPQTKWPCTHCGGEGCDECNQTGKQYPHTVEDLVAKPFIKATDSEEHKFHGAGREDRDALMLGEGRPFVIEILEPRKRELNLKEIQKKINKEAKDKVEVEELRKSSKEEVVEIKAGEYDKTYEVWAKTRDEITKEDMRKVEKELEGTVIEQRTPTRVNHRRADKVRKRKIHKIKMNKVNDNEFKAEIKAESGTYIKELLSGDYGRTRQSVAEIIKNKVTPQKLNVLKIHGTN